MDTTFYSSVKSFVDDLWEVYGTLNKPTPLALYRRLLDHINKNDTLGIDKIKNGFNDFYDVYFKYIVNDEMNKINEKATIRYDKSNGVYLEIGKFIKLSDTDTVNAIRQHLLTIYAILNPSNEVIEKLESTSSTRRSQSNELPIDTSTPEGEFIGGIMNKVKDSVDVENMSNPAQTITSLMSSGVIQDMVSGLQSGIARGEMDINRMLSSMQSMIGSLMTDVEDFQKEEGITTDTKTPDSPPKIEEIHDD